MSNLGETYRELARPGEREAMGRLAEQEYRRAVAADPTDHAAHFNLGHLHNRRAEFARRRRDRARSGLEYEMALPRLQCALAILLRQAHFSWTAARYRHELGIAYWNLGERARAVTQFRAAVRLEPRNVLARRHLRMALDAIRKSHPPRPSQGRQAPALEV